MTAPAAALLTAALLAGSVLLVAPEPVPGPVAGPAAVVDSPRPTAATPEPERAPEPEKTPPPAPGSRTGYSWPLTGPPTVVRGFSVGPFRWSPGHRGVDLTAEPGQEVLAAGTGRVAFTGLVAGRPVVVVAHVDGLRTTYEPVAGVVPVGAEVARGHVIGRLAPRSAHCGDPCLHWGARRGDQYVDPLRLLGPRHPVLLPLRLSAGNVRRCPFDADPTSVTTRSTDRRCPVARSVTRAT